MPGPSRGLLAAVARRASLPASLNRHHGLDTVLSNQFTNLEEFQ